MVQIYVHRSETLSISSWNLHKQTRFGNVHNLNITMNLCSGWKMFQVSLSLLMGRMNLFSAASDSTDGKLNTSPAAENKTEGKLTEYLIFQTGWQQMLGVRRRQLVLHCWMSAASKCTKRCSSLIRTNNQHGGQRCSGVTDVNNLTVGNVEALWHKMQLRATGGGDMEILKIHSELPAPAAALQQGADLFIFNQLLMSALNQKLHYRIS